jgi:hypothetical protein
VEPTFHSLPIRTRTGLKPTEDLYHKDTKDTKKQKITQEGRKGRKGMNGLVKGDWRFARPEQAFSASKGVIGT